MQCKNLKTLPCGMKLTSLEQLNLLGCSSLQSFPEILDKMKKVRTLDFAWTAIEELPSSFTILVGLKSYLWIGAIILSGYLLAFVCCALSAHACRGMRHLKMCKGGEEASSDCSTVSSKLKHFCFSNCNLSNDSLAFCLLHFTNMERLNLSSNNFKTLPACIEDSHCLRYLGLDNCKLLQHIAGMPPNLTEFSAKGCTLLTKLSRSRVLHQAFDQEPGKRNFTFSGKEIPKMLDQCSLRSCYFWVQFPPIFLWILVKDDQDCSCQPNTSVRINNQMFSLKYPLPIVVTNHIYIWDLQSFIESPLGVGDNELNISFEKSKWKMKSERKIYLAIYPYWQENIRLLGDIHR